MFIWSGKNYGHGQGKSGESQEFNSS